MVAGDTITRGDALHGGQSVSRHGRDS